VDTKTKQMSLLSIPRDTRVNIPKYGWDKINAADALGGPELSMKVVSNLLDIPEKYYVQANFNGFKDIVDALGGVTLDVEQNMYHEDETDGGAYEINLKKGVQRLDGDKALQYVRYRDYAMGDIDRTKYQQKFLVALAKEMLQPSTILKLPALVPEISARTGNQHFFSGIQHHQQRFSRAPPFFAQRPPAPHEPASISL
jgi:LCP family protein required for cell wall assembly